MHTARQTPDSATLVAFVVAVTVGGGNFIAVRVSNTELPPFWGAGLRFGLAAIAFVGIAAALKIAWPRGRQLALSAAFGLLSIGLFYALMYWALVIVAAGVATIVLAMVPLVTVLLAATQRLERLRVRSLVGAGLALAGVLWMTLGPQQVVVPLAALVAMLVAALCAGQSIIIGKRLAPTHPVAINAVGMAVGAVLLLVLSLVAGEAWSLPATRDAQVAVVYLVALGSVGLFVLLLMIVRRWTSSATSYLFVLFPVSTLLLEAVLLGEPVTLQVVIGALLVMSGVWFGALSPGARHAAARRDHGRPVETT